MSSTLDPAGQGLSAEEKRRLLARILQQKAARATRFPLSFAQQRLWFLHQMDPASPLYNMFSAARLRGHLNAGALDRTLVEIVRRHEVLRTVFAVEEGEPVQVVAPPGSWRMEAEDLGGLGEEEREAEVQRRVQAEAVRPFDLSAGPLFRALLLRCGPEEHVLFLGMHHVVSDGWSMEVLYRELDAVYTAFLRGESSPLPELALQYADFAAWQRERLRGPVLEPHLAFWREQLAGAPAVLELPADRPRPAAQTFRGASLPVAFDAGLTGKL
ncbi:MAG TPA: condensation domain-containing protein, partial [Longimicrobiaceae bacterium]